MKKKDVAKNIRESLGMSDIEKLDEALVVQAKPFAIPTEALSGENIRNHYSLYEAYAKDFNKINKGIIRQFMGKEFDKGLSSKTVARRLASIKSFFNYLIL